MVSFLYQHVVVYTTIYNTEQYNNKLLVFWMDDDIHLVSGRLIIQTDGLFISLEDFLGSTLSTFPFPCVRRCDVIYMSYFLLL